MYGQTDPPTTRVSGLERARACPGAQSPRPTWWRRELFASPCGAGPAPVNFTWTLFVAGSLATFVGLPPPPLEPGAPFLFLPRSLSRGVCGCEQPPCELTGSSLDWWTNGPSESVESPLLTMTLILLMGSAGLPPGGPLPGGSCRTPAAFALLPTQVRPRLWEDVPAEGQGGPEGVTQFFRKDSVE